MKLIYAPSAEADLDEIFDYIAIENQRAAEEVILRIEQTLVLVSNFPEMGRPGIVAETREFSIPNLSYRIVYRLEDDAVRVLNVIHTSRQWPEG